MGVCVSASVAMAARPEFLRAGLRVIGDNDTCTCSFVHQQRREGWYPLHVRYRRSLESSLLDLHQTIFSTKTFIRLTYCRSNIIQHAFSLFFCSDPLDFSMMIVQSHRSSCGGCCSGCNLFRYIIIVTHVMVTNISVGISKFRRRRSNNS